MVLSVRGSRAVKPRRVSCSVFFPATTSRPFSHATAELAEAKDELEGGGGGGGGGGIYLGSYTRGETDRLLDIAADREVLRKLKSR